VTVSLCCTTQHKCTPQHLLCVRCVLLALIQLETATVPACHALHNVIPSMQIPCHLGIDCVHSRTLPTQLS
jgi:hypothetical protein